MANTKFPSPMNVAAPSESLEPVAPSESLEPVAPSESSEPVAPSESDRYRVIYGSVTFSAASTAREGDVVQLSVDDAKAFLAAGIIEPA